MAVLAFVAGLVVAGTIVALRSGPDSTPSRDRASAPTSTPGSASASSLAVEVDLRPEAGFLTTVEELQVVADRARRGEEPWSSAVERLREEADEAAAQEPQPANPLRIEETTGPFVDDTADAYTLALAYRLIGDERYAAASARFIDAWVTTADETADTCTDDGSCTTSLVLGRMAPAFVFAADLLDGSSAFDDAADERFRVWLRDVILPAASERTNNWGDAGTFLRIAATAYLGDEAGFAAAIETWQTQADLIEADGEIPEETRRGGDGLQYSQEALLYKVASARIAERHGVDLWGYRGAGGGSLEVALDLVADSFERPSQWRWHDDVEVPSPAPLWELAAARWPKPAYRELAASGRPFGPGGHSAIRWTTLAGGAPSD